MREVNADTVLGAFCYVLVAVLALFLILGLVFHTLEIKRPKEWQICWDLPLTGETVCGGHKFDSLDQCETTKSWFDERIDETWEHTDKAAQNHRCEGVN